MRGETNRGRRFPPEVLTHDEVMTLLDACGNGSPTALRNRALIAVLYRCGLRISEALALYPKDVDLEQGAIRVLSGKGGRSRVVGVDDGAVAFMKAWIAARASLGLDATRPFFCSIRGNRMQEAYFRVMFRELGRKAGISKRVHAHGLRHTHAAQLRAEHVDIGIISKQLGHRSIATTARYLDHIAPWDVVRVMRERQW